MYFLSNSNDSLVTFFVVLLILIIIFLLTRIKKCPANKIMVIYGMVGKNKDGSPKSALIVNGGSKFIIPIVQAVQYLNLKPIKVNLFLQNVLTKQKEHFEFSSVMKVAIAKQHMGNAVERLLGLKEEEIQDLVIDIAFGQLRLYIATLNIDQVNDISFIENLVKIINTELEKIGIEIISFNLNYVKEQYKNYL